MLRNLKRRKALGAVVKKDMKEIVQSFIHLSKAADDLRRYGDPVAQGVAHAALVQMAGLCKDLAKKAKKGMVQKRTIAHGADR